MRLIDHVEFEQWVPTPLEKTFLFFANPNNLPRIMPPSTGMRLLEVNRIAPPGAGTPEMKDLAGAGSQIVTSFRVVPFLPIRAIWVALITEFEWNHHFADIQKKGPFRHFHHRHQFAAEVRQGTAGTIVRDVIEYEVGFGPVGTAAQRLLVTRQLRRTFAYRQQALEKILG